MLDILPTTYTISFSCISSSPSGTITSFPLTIIPISTEELDCLSISLIFLPIISIPQVILSSTILTLPLANLSTLIADEKFIVLAISSAAVYSGFIIKSRPNSSFIRDSSSEYSGFLTRATVCFTPSFLAVKQHTILTSSLPVTAISKSALATPASNKMLVLTPFPFMLNTSKLSSIF
ncbi:hypothetical protein D3C73_1068640 [compost metagenome]